MFQQTRLHRAGLIWVLVIIALVFKRMIQTNKIFLYQQEQLFAITDIHFSIETHYIGGCPFCGYIFRNKNTNPVPRKRSLDIFNAGLLFKAIMKRRTV